MNDKALLRITAPALAPKASRIARALLIHPKREWGVVEIAKAVGISPGYAVKILGDLQTAGIIRRNRGGCTLVQPHSLLEAWASTRNFGEREALRNFMVLGDPTRVEARFLAACRKLNSRYALTLFTGADRRAPFIHHARVFAYFEGDPAPVLREVGAEPVSEGGTLVLVQPYDEGVFFGVQVHNGAQIVADAQLYVDLFNFGVRGREQAEFLREACMPELVSGDSPESRARFQEALGTRDRADRALEAADYGEATRLYEELAGRLAVLRTAGAESELRRARLLLWIALVHVAFERQDRVSLEKARAICVTDREVEELRREVGFSTAPTELALVAYYAALALLAGEEAERSRYVEKARTHLSIATGPYTPSGPDVAEAARRIWGRLGSPR